MKNQVIISFIIKAIIIVILVNLSSCASRTDMVYFQDKLTGSYTQPVIKPEIKYQPDDMLTIDVSGLDPDAVRPFNLPAVSYSESVASASGDLKMQTYLVDKDGNIDFPVLGIIKLEGLTRLEATTLLKGKLSEYVKDPIVNIRLANFTISVLGEVKEPGAYTIQDEKVSLTEALGLAGDLTEYGRRDNVLLIREVGGQKKFAKFDLTNVKVLASPNYYLAQNDVIYVEPNKARINSSKFSQNNGIIISAVGTLATIVAILIK